MSWMPPTAPIPHASALPQPAATTAESDGDDDDEDDGGGGGDGDDADGDDDGTARLIAERFSRHAHDGACEPKKKRMRASIPLALSPRQPSAAAIADIRGRVQTARPNPWKRRADPLFFLAAPTGGGGGAATFASDEKRKKNEKKGRKDADFSSHPHSRCRSAVRMAAAGTPQPDASMRHLNPAPASQPGD